MHVLWLEVQSLLAPLGPGYQLLPSVSRWKPRSRESDCFVRDASLHFSLSPFPARPLLSFLPLVLVTLLCKYILNSSYGVY